MTLVAPRLAHLKDGREVLIRQGAAGDEAGIARLLVEGFPVYLAAARGNPERAVACLTQEIQVEQAMVAVLPESRLIIGVDHFYESTLGRAKGREAILVKLKLWGWYGALRFIRAKITARLMRPAVRIAPGEICKMLAAVDGQYQSQGILKLLADFVDDYAVARGCHATWSLHKADNLAVLAVQRKRGCTLTQLPPTPLGRWLKLPQIIQSVKRLGEASTRERH